MKKPAIFFDRDGVINRRRVDDYVKSWEEFEFLPEIFTVLADVAAAGYRTVLVTNQRGVSRGLMQLADLTQIHEKMQQELHEQTGARFDAIYYCPHGNDDRCDCRKPLPGMLLRAAQEHAIDMAASWMIGDSESDIEAGLAAGCRAVLVAVEGTGSRAHIVVESLADAWKYIRQSAQHALQQL